MHSIAEEVCAQSASWMPKQNVSFALFCEGGVGWWATPGDKIHMHAPIVHKSFQPYPPPNDLRECHIFYAGIETLTL